MAVRQYYPRPENVITTNYVNGTNGDIINTIINAYPLAVLDCEKHARILKTGDFEKDCATIWNVLKTELTYKRDLDELQTIALPRMAFSRVKNDCKSFSLCASGLIGAMGYIAIIRFAGYKKDNPYPTHVYALAMDPQTKKKIIIDGCAPYFNWEKPPIIKKDYPMNVVTLSDQVTDKENIEKIISKMPRSAQSKLSKISELAAQQAVLQYQKTGEIPMQSYESINKKPEKGTPERDALHEKNVEKAKEDFKKIGKGAVTLALVLGRAAFLAIIRLNFNGVASKLQKLIKTNKISEVDTKWVKLGGNVKAYHFAINKGAEHRPVFLSKKAKERFNKTMAVNGIHGCHYSEIGICEPALAALAATAIPVLAVIIPIMKKAFAGMGKAGQAESEELTAQATDIVKGSYTTDEAVPNEMDYVEIPETIGDGTGSEIWGALGKLAGDGIKKLAEKIKNKHPKVAPIIDKGGQAAEDYATGKYMRDAGYTGKIETLSNVAKGAQGYILPIAIVGAAGVVYLATKKK